VSSDGGWADDGTSDREDLIGREVRMNKPGSLLDELRTQYEAARESADVMI